MGGVAGGDLPRYQRLWAFPLGWVAEPREDPLLSLISKPSCVCEPGTRPPAAFHCEVSSAHLSALWFVPFLPFTIPFLGGTRGKHVCSIPHV